MMIGIPLTPDLVHGAIDLDATDRGLRPQRLPSRVRERDADPQLTAMRSQPSGVRVRFATEASAVALDLHALRISYRGLDRPRGAVDVVVDGDVVAQRMLRSGDTVEVDLQTGASTFVPGDAESIEVTLPPGGTKVVELWLPHNEQVDLGSLRADGAVRPAPEDGPLWVHHGSSISQGSNASSPTAIWPVVAARRAGVRLHNLGFGGSALADPFLARVIRDSPADLISIKLGINIVGLDVMRLRSFVPAIHGFLDTIRDGHPDTPLRVISPIFCGIHEQTPGPGAMDTDALGRGEVRFIATGDPADTASGRLTLEVVRTALEQIVAARSGDPNLAYLDGRELYGAADAARLPLPDDLHPGTPAHELIGSRFADLILDPALRSGRPGPGMPIS